MSGDESLPTSKAKYFLRLGDVAIHPKNRITIGIDVIHENYRMFLISITTNTARNTREFE